MRTAYNHAKERIDLPLPLTRIEMEVLTGPVKEFKKVNNSISRVIRLLIDKQRILFSEVWDGVDYELTQKREGQSTKFPYVRPYIYTNKLVVCLSTNGE